MATNPMFKALVCISLLASPTFSMPSFDHGSFDGAALLALGSVLKPRAEPFEIRGVYGGRKKLYIVERDEPRSCCKEKLICWPSVGQILKDCKCQKCPTGFPALGGNSCQDNCPDGQEKNDQGGCCPIGQKPKATGDGCEPKQSDNDRKGGCPDDTVLDPKQGWDPKTESPKCQIDDEKKCAKPKTPATRPDGMENDASYEVRCGDVDDSKRPKCDPKTQYVDTSVDTDGKALQRCKHTRKFQDRKRTKPTNSDIRAKIKDQWNKMKPDNDKRDKERQANLDKLKNLREERDKKAKEYDNKREADDKKKERMGKCNPIIALLIGAATNAAQNSKRDDEHPYDWTSWFFDEDFVSSDERIKDWPPEIDVNQISLDVNENKWLEKWSADLDERKRSLYVNCNFVGKRSLERRCSAKRSLEGDWYDDDDFDADFDTLSANNTSVIERYAGPTNPATVSARDLIDLEKRNPFAWLFSILAQFGTRVATGVVARVTASVAANSPRLANLLKNTERLFQVAKPGEGAKSGLRGMENAKDIIKKDKNWLKCLKEGIP